MTEHPPSPELIQARELLDTWIDAFRGPLVGMLASWGSDWRSAEELAQDTFAEAWVSRERFVGDPHNLELSGPWLRGIAFNLHRSAKRKASAHAALSLEDRDQDLAKEEAEPDERRDAMAQAFGTLKPAHQNILRMHYLEKTSAREVAALLGLTPKAVESRLYQARKALRDRIEKTVNTQEVAR
jgi:RNA polymerase sigma factor (sigma-70 family)